MAFWFLEKKKANMKGNWGNELVGEMNSLLVDNSCNPLIRRRTPTIEIETMNRTIIKILVSEIVFLEQGSWSLLGMWDTTAQGWVALQA
eukprot:1351864-Amorphochlora_amoeboformis.AAC.1